MKRYCDELACLQAGEAGKKALVELLMAHEAKETQTGPRSRRPVLRTALIAAVVAALLAAGALAANLGVWQRFFRGSGESSVTPVGASATTGDYTLTLAESIVNEDEATFLLALTRTDGGVLEGEPRLDGHLFYWQMKVDGQPLTFSMDSQPPILSEDGRTVYYCVSFGIRNEECLIGRELTFACSGVADMAWSQEEIDQVKTETVSLAPMAERAAVWEQDWDALITGVEQRNENLARIKEEMADVSIPLALGDGQVAWISGVIFTADGPVITTDCLVDRYREGQYLTTSATPMQLIDTRTGASYGNTAGVSGLEHTYAALFEDCPLTTADLPYVELKVRYGMEKVLSDEPVELTFRAEKGGGIVKEVGQAVAIEDYYRHEGTLSSVRISSLGLRLNMENTVLSAANGKAGQTVGRLVMKDGSQWALHMSTFGTDRETGNDWIKLEIEDEQGRRALIDPQAVQTLILGDCEIDLAA